MDNQHRQIKGYRELNAEEIALMNEIKSKGAELGDLVAKLRQYGIDGSLPPDHRGPSPLDQRWISIGRALSPHLLRRRLACRAGPRVRPRERCDRRLDRPRRVACGIAAKLAPRG